MKLGFKKIHQDAKLPSYAHESDAGMDICAISDEVLKVGVPKLIKTGLVAQIPEGYELQVRPRSGLALKRGITVWNSPGTIDSGYRGEIGVILMYMNSDSSGDILNRITSISKGERIAQLVLAPVTKADVVEIEDIEDTDRGTGGFGSTGV